VRVILKLGHLILSPESEAERAAFAIWREAARGHVFHFDGGSVDGGALRDLGLRAEACREPINVVFDQVEPCWQPISNLAHTPFMLRGMAYASVEGFWQGLKFDGDADRARIAALWGKPAKRAAAALPERASFDYGGETYAVGGPGHHALMLAACRAKFAQHAGARDALLATGDRPLIHRPRRDSATIPGALMADIWMRLRAGLRSASGAAKAGPAASDSAIMMSTAQARRP
jgi:predicted NAD-dependent protein-ADP-ribosyltransferase YbiA (DUF1768 family)